MTRRRKWNDADMLNAVTVVKEKKLGYKRAAKLYSVPRATLKDYVKSPQDATEKLKTKLGRPSTLPPHCEDELKKYCLQMDSHFYGLTAGDLSRMAYELAIRNNLPNPFSKEKKKAGRKWRRLFFKRHPELSIRKPQNLSMGHIQGFSKKNVDEFFKILKPQLEKSNLMQHVCSMSTNRVFLSCNISQLALLQPKGRKKFINLHLQSAEQQSRPSSVCLLPVSTYLLC